MKEVAQAGLGFDSLRSLLFCPVNDMRKMQKALGSGADAAVGGMDGKMVDPVHLRLARRYLLQAGSEKNS